MHVTMILYFPYLGTSDEQRTPDIFLNATFHFFINGAVQTTITSYDVNPVSIITRGWFDYPQVICRWRTLKKTD